MPRDQLLPGTIRIGQASAQDVLVAPLRTATGELLGVITVGRLEVPFEPQDCELLAAFVHAGTLALKARDYETQGHTARTVDLAMQLGQRVGLGPAELEALRQGAYLHDLGKLSVSDSVLLKPGPLTPEERAIIQSHAVVGESLARRVSGFAEGTLAVVRSHHERWDGQGYPDGLSGAQIPLLARLFAVVDVYDTLSHDRPYRPAFSTAETLEFLHQNAGSHFDPQVVEALIELLKESSPAAPSEGAGRA